MYGLSRLAPGRFHVVVPPRERIPLPFGLPVNVGVLDGAVPTLVDTGFVGGRDSLVAALAELGISPATVGKVVLTSLLPEAVGNVEVFENATVHVVGAPSARIDLVAHAAALRAEIEATALGLVRGPERHPDWSADDVELALDVYFHGLPDALDVVPVDDGAAVAAAAGATLVAHAAPGVDDFAACWTDPAARILFGGETLTRSPRPRIRRAAAYTESLGRVSAGTPDLIVASHGPAERSYALHFRSLNLGVANLVQSMPFALDGPTPAARIAWRDLGVWPRDVVRFAAEVLRFQVPLDELVASGVASREGSGPWAVYSMERPPRT